jgi:DNA-binding NtrC family response regulator
MQVKLLRTIQQREIKRVGDNRTIKIDVRIIAATNRDLFEGIKNGTFREDLYYRINVFGLKIPPLRDRKEDIPLLIDFFLKKSPARQKTVQVSREAMKMILDYPFPGNIRELENIIERALILCEDNIITFSDLPPEMLEAVQAQFERPRKHAGVFIAAQRTDAARRAPSAEDAAPLLRTGRQQAEKEIIMQALQATEQNRAQAAKLLKIGRTSLYRKMKQLGLE